MIKLLNHKITNKTIYGIVELEIRGQKFKYSYQQSTDCLIDDGYQLENGDENYLTNDEQEIIDNILNGIFNKPAVSSY